MTERFHRMQAAGISLAVDLAVGHIRDFTVEMGGRTADAAAHGAVGGRSRDHRRSGDPGRT